MTYMLTADPGKNSGIVRGFYDATTPFRLVERWQVHGGLDGFVDWWQNDLPEFDEFVCERFDLADNDFKADLTPAHIEGAIRVLHGKQVIWQPRTDKARLVGYPKSATTKAQRQRVRFDFLEKYGMFAAGADNDDSNDAVTHSLVSLRKRRHLPTMRAYWGPGRA